MDREYALLFGPEAPDIADVVAAALFEPKVERWGGVGGLGVALLVADWVRIRRAIRVDRGLADRSINVVTLQEVYALSAALPRLQKIPRDSRRCPVSRSAPGGLG